MMYFPNYNNNWYLGNFCQLRLGHIGLLPTRDDVNLSEVGFVPSVYRVKA